MFEEFLGADRRAPAMSTMSRSHSQRARPRRIALVDMLAIAPMRRHAALGDVVHLLRADLHFDALLLRPDDGGVDGAVAVEFSDWR